MNPFGAVPASLHAKLPPIGFLILSICLGLASLYLAPSAVRKPIWKDYRTVLVDAVVPEGDVLTALEMGGYRRIVSFSTQPVLVSNWVRLESMTLGSSLERLIPGDPRRDWYLESLATWFTAQVDGRPFRIFYIPVSSPFFSDDSVREALSPFFGRFLLPDLDRGRVEGGAERTFHAVIVALALFIAVIAGAYTPNRSLLGQSQKKMTLRASLALPWIPLSAMGFPFAVLAFIWACALIDMASTLDLPAEEYCRSKRISSSFASLACQRKWPIALLVVAFLATALNASNSVSVLFALSASVTSFAFIMSLRAQRPSLRRRFVPRPLATIPIRKKKNDWINPALVALAIVFWGTSLLVGRSPDSKVEVSMEVPLPRVMPGNLRPGPAESMARVSEKNPGELPDMPSWLVHRAIQEAMPLLRLGEPREKPFASVLLPGAEGQAHKLDFNEEWARAAYGNIPAASIENMVLSQGMAVAAVSGRWVPGGNPPLAPIMALLYIFLLVPPLWRIIAGLPAARNSPSGKLRQEA
jgi:hypothetical protein